MLIPLRSDRRLQSTPWMNYALITVNILVFLFTERQVQLFANYAVAADQLMELRSKLWVINFYLWPDPALTNLWQFVSYQFLHADLWHLGGNMIFLWVFGNSVEDRVGKVGYLAFYLAGGVIAGLGHVFTSEAPVLGASGSVAAVSGAFLAMFPLSQITLAFFGFFAAFEVSGMVLILFYIAADVMMNLAGAMSVAYTAHLAGYAFGFTVGMGLLGLRILEREPYDMLALIQQKRRRAKFRQLNRQGSMFQSDAAEGMADRPLDPKTESIQQHRAAVLELAGKGQYAQAAEAYMRLLESGDPDHVLPQQTQLDLANHLMASRRYTDAARAYELFLKTFSTFADRQEIQLILGLIYANYLDKPQRGRELLQAALPRLHGSHRAQAKEALQTLGDGS